MKKLLTIATLSVFALALPGGSFAAEKKAKTDAAPEAKKAEPPPAAKKAEEKPAAKEEAKAGKAVPYHGDVASVDTSAKSFTFKNKAGTERVFGVNDKTEITKDGTKADFAAITVGAYATGQYIKGADGKLEAVSVKIAPKPAKKAADEKKPEEKPADKKKPS
ncbi:MAG: hypothetical protein QOE70_3295 [Chthoniobacter sp.]|jgi:hypothetical protein|nr:hypothetical protein [Chthoniobacter sp.]